VKKATLASWILGITLYPLMISPPAVADGHKSLCPDMSQHEKVLKEGEDCHARGGSPLTFPPETEPGDFVPSELPYRAREAVRHVNGQKLLRPKDAFICGRDLKTHGTPTYSLGPYGQTRGYYRASGHDDPSEQVAHLPLGTPFQIESARITARGLEGDGNYDLALRLYRRIQVVQAAISRKGNHGVSTSCEDVERVEAIKSAIDAIGINEYQKSALAYDHALTLIAPNQSLTLDDKVTILKPIVFRLEPLQSNGSPQAKQIYLKGKALYNDYRKSLQCLEMAHKLNAMAGYLLADRNYARAEKLYKDALEIKRKNLGPNDPDTLTEVLNLARLYGAQGNYALASQTFEQLLSNYRKLPKPPDEYATTLESYGDMLNSAKKEKEAELVYAEARAFYRKHPSVTNN
jgi:tetratricopeptide (TPR) repeat protein